MSERDHVIALDSIDGIGPVRLAKLVAHFLTAAAAWRAPTGDLRRLLPAPVVARLEAARRAGEPGRRLDELARRGIRPLTYLDDNYPAGLSFLADRPPVLYTRGDLRVLEAGIAVAVVGTRKPTPYGREAAYQLAAGLAGLGVTIVSGLAEGIDGAAHRAALEVGGRTIAVLGSGLDRVAPEAHAGLARAIARQGAVISQFAPDSIARKGTFPRRNWVVAALARGVIVAEAPARSGALVTGRAAARLGRPVLVVPGPITAPTYQGCLTLLREGARGIGSVDHVIEDLGLGPALAALAAAGRAPGTGRVDGTPVASRLPVAGEAARVLEAIAPGETVPFALLMARTGLAPGCLGAALGRLEVGGWVARQPGQCYTRL